MTRTINKVNKLMHTSINAITDQINSIILGKNRQIRLAVACLLSRGRPLLQRAYQPLPLPRRGRRPDRSPRQRAAEPRIRGCEASSARTRRAGTPLIVSDIGGMAEKVLPGETGLHFRRGDAGHLVQVMQTLVLVFQRSHIL